MKPKLLLLFLVPCLALSPFLSKAFHIDDTLFLYAARQIRENPLRPYDFSVNWYGTTRGMWGVTKNPPLTSYWLAALGAVWGERERAMHTGFLPFAGLAVLGMFALSKQFVRNPWPPTLALACCPAFLISATNLMADVPMLSMYVWAVVCFLRGSQRGHRATLVLAGVMVGLALVTKYTAVTIVPLLAAYVVLRKVPVRMWAASLVAAGVIFGLWCLHGIVFYGMPHFGGTLGYQWSKRLIEGRFVGQAAACMTFFGGCGLVPLFFLPARAWRKMAAACAVICGGIVVLMGVGAASMAEFGDSILWQSAFFVFAVGFGASVMVCFAAFCRRTKRLDRYARDEVFLWLWLGGMIVFVAVVNWTVAGRFVLLGLPPWFILASRHAERDIASRVYRRLAGVGCAVAFIMSMLLCQADAAHADAYREFTQRLLERPDLAGRRVWFSGHWGWQYYMERAGFHLIDNTGAPITKSDAVVVASHCANVYVPPSCRGMDAMVETYDVRGNRLHVMNQDAFAGFYSDRAGLLPYSFAPRVLVERFYLYRFWPVPVQ